jgi:signal transduction histidine kinase
VPEPKLILQRWHPLTRLALFVLLHGASTWLGMRFSSRGEHVFAVWPSSGVALSALLLSRFRDWPALLLAAFLLEPFGYAPGQLPAASHFVFSAGNTLEALTGAFLLRRHLGFRPSLERVRDLLALGGFAAVLSTQLSAVPGVTLLALLEKISWTHWWTHWRVFWMSDAMGVLLVTPLLLSWAMRGLEGWSRVRRLELTALLLALGFSSHVFFHWTPVDSSVYHPVSYLAFPFILWAALRFEVRGTSAALLVLTAVALEHAESGSGPFSGGIEGLSTYGERLVLLQSFLAAVGLSGLLVAAAVGERRRTQEMVSNLNQELRQSLEALATTQRELVRRERLAAVGEMAASVAHEVRNPLAVISNSVAALSEGPLAEEDAREVRGLMREEVTRLDHLITGLLDFARPAEPRLFPQSLGALVEEALESSLRSMPRSERVEVKRTLEELPELELDAQQTHLALSNLFTNALQAMPQGGALQVELRRELLDGQPPRARLAITDTGPGITPEGMARLFEPFYTTKASGTGLGLAMVRRIVEAHHGEVQVRSTPGQGTTFLVYLPLGKAARSTQAA